MSAEDAVVRAPMGVVRISAREARLRRKVREHLRELGYTKSAGGILIPPSLDKDSYRVLHLPQREARLAKDARFLAARQTALIGHFATGAEVDLKRFRVRLELVDTETWQAELFRFATLLWSIPVSQGFGRRLRYLVWDDSIGRLAGLFALTDPVFNLRARDEEIGWTSDDRSDRLIYLMDGYVVGAVPPYSRILGGKLIACLLRSKEVVSDFREKYGGTDGVISGKSKNAHLVAVTTTSALGRSSVYNRLRLGGTEYLTPLGYTSGYGHFHFPDTLFAEMRAYLKARRDTYEKNNRFGDGPNWKMRAIRRTLQLLGMNPALLKHGLARQVFMG
ncbi:MAG: Druantia anti-phage system protein DruA, partial [Candidatus Dormibacteraceae bacterium]